MAEGDSWFKRHKFLTIIIILFCVFFLLAVLSPKKEIPAADGENRNLEEGTGNNSNAENLLSLGWEKARTDDFPQVNSKWNTPVRLGISEDGSWIDSMFVSSDGKKVYFMYYPGDLLSAVINGGPFIDDIDVYFSNEPFETKAKENRYHLSDDVWTAGGLMISSEGDYYYHDNKPMDSAPNDYQTRIYRNDELLDFNDPDVPFDNPHYCSAKDELWFDTSDKEIYFLKEAKKNGFSGKPELAPSPINSFSPGITESQPWLSDDCNTIYFSSSRGTNGAGHYIYTATRFEDYSWSEPEVVVTSKLSVGEPTLTSDMKKMFFIQVLRNDDGKFTTNAFYAESKE